MGLGDLFGTVKAFGQKDFIVKRWFAIAIGVLVVGMIVAILVLAIKSNTSGMSDLIYGPISSGATMRAQAQLLDHTGAGNAMLQDPYAQGFLGSKEPPVFYNVGNLSDSTGRLIAEGNAAQQGFEPYTGRFEAFDAGSDRFAERMLGLPRM